MLKSNNNQNIINNQIIKKVEYNKSKMLNIYSGYTFIQGFRREILCMKLLYNSYNNCPCSCGSNKSHFPSIIKYNVSNNSGYIKMTHQGFDIQYLFKRNIKLNHVLSIESATKQIDCILNTMNYCNIMHLDLNNNGKDDIVVVTESDDIMYLINIDNKHTLTPLMYKRIHRFYKTDFKQKIMNIILKVL